MDMLLRMIRDVPGTLDYLRRCAAGALAEESAALFRDIGDVYGLGSVLYIMANAAVGRGDYERAESS